MDYFEELQPQQPHKWGYKTFVLSRVFGFAYETEIETDKENIVLLRKSDLYPSSNDGMRLVRMITRYQTRHSQSWYRAKKIILDCKLSSEKIIMKKERGYSVNTQPLSTKSMSQFRMEGQ